MKKLIRLILIVSLINAVLFAANSVPDQGKDDAVVLPILFSTPETGLGYGFTTIYYQDTPFKAEKDDVWQLVLFGTQKRQSLYSLSIEKYLADGKLLASLFSNGDNSKYYGIGQDSHLQDEEIFVQYIVKFKSTLLYELNADFSLGPSLSVGRYDLLEVSDNASLIDSDLPGLKGTIVSGIGYTLHHDSRDNNIYPESGKVFNFKQLFYQKAIGSDFDFSTVDIDLRYYLRLYKKSVLALRFHSLLSGGQVPFQLKPRINLRGIYIGRYSDNNYLSGELEYRAPFLGKSKYTIFGGWGQVAEHINQFNAEKILSTYGIGLRYPLDRQAKVNVRIDLAFSREEKLFYLNLMEAF